MFQPGGVSSLLKEGTKHFSGVEESCLKNIEACQALSHITRTSLGPNGMSKMLINQHDKLSVTSDAATIIKELDVIHPAAKMLVMASQMQESDCGDGTNFVVVFGGELLSQAGGLIRQGVHPADIISGFTKASTKALEILSAPEITAFTLDDPRDAKKAERCLRSALASKQYGYEDKLASLIAEACIQTLPKSGPVTSFKVDSVRVTKILGGGVTDTRLVKGFVLPRDAEGTIKTVRKAKIAVFVSGIDMAKPETKGTVLIKTADQLRNFTKEEERQMETIVKGIADSGANVIVSGNAVSDIAMHFIERYKMMCVKVTSKFQLRRVCQAVGATALVRLGAPTAEELGHCDIVTTDEIGSTKVTVFRQEEKEDSQISTLVVRASTNNVLDDIERAVDDGVNVFKNLIRDGRMCAGAGATEIELARRLAAFAEATPGLDQYALKRYAEAFEVVPRTLAENAGQNALETIYALYAAHSGGAITAGVDVEGGGVKDAVGALNVLDSVLSKFWAIKYASDVVCTILRVDQIIMAKIAGGPKPKQMKGDGDEDGGVGLD